MLTGSIVAIATPMQRDGALDLPALDKLIDFHVANGTSGIVVVGTTGESPTVDVDEHRLLIRHVVERAAGRVGVIAGTGANSTAEAVALTTYAREVGAKCCLSVVPYYNKPPQEGLYRHFRAFAEVGLPVILYKVPGIVGLKDATSDLVRHVDLVKRLPSGKAFALYSGNDDTALAYMLLGGHGVISVTANVAPKAMSQMCAAALGGDIAGARAINQKLMGLHTKLFVEANPIPVKWAMAQLGLIQPDLRLPLTGLAPEHHDTVRAAL